MKDHSYKSKDYDALGKCLDELEITVCEDDGGFTVFTVSEPLFCFTRPSVREIEEVVVNTLRSYLETFYEVENVKIKAEAVSIEVPTIPQKRLRPISFLRPVIGEPGKGRRLVPA